MVRNYLRLAQRHLGRHKGYTLLNVAGLSAGLACCLLILLFIRNERAVNHTFPKVDRLHRVDSQWREPGMGLDLVTVAPAGPALMEALPEVVAQARLYHMRATMGHGETFLRRDGIVADPSAFALFDWPLLHGDAATALADPRSIVLEEALARDLFGRTDVLGEVVEVETWQQGRQPYTVTGVWPTLPYNSLTHIGGSTARFLLPPPTVNQDFVGEDAWNSWASRYIMVVVETTPGTDAEALNRKLGGFIEQHAPEHLHGDLALVLNPMSTLYLNEQEGLGRRMLYLLGGLAALVLLIACINFTNLATARSLTRAREIGVRKALGAQRAQLAAQFLGEALLIAALAALVAVALAELLVEPFFALADKEIVLRRFWDGTTGLLILGVWLGTGLVAGGYPALILSGFQPVRALKGRLTLHPATARLRQSLVVVQFAAAVVLLVAVVAITRQVDFLVDRSLGYHEERMLVIDTVPRDWTADGLARMEQVRHALTQVPGVLGATLTYDTPTLGPNFFGNSIALRRPEAQDPVNLTLFRADDAFLDTYGLTLAAGRFFDASRPADDAGVVLNETAVRAFGWEDPIGQLVQVDGTTQVPVVGVVRDFHFASLHSGIRPLALFSLRGQPLYRLFNIRLAPGDVPATLARLETEWQRLLPGTPFGYTFLDDTLRGLYQTEQQLRQVVAVGAGLALLLACLGMLGLAALSVAQRTKEIGVRKVLGASVRDVLLLLSADFTRPVLLALLLALPLGFFLMDHWLGTFAYRIDLGLGMLLLAGGTALLVAWLTVSYHAARAATTNPADALRQE